MVFYREEISGAWMRFVPPCFAWFPTTGDVISVSNITQRMARRAVLARSADEVEVKVALGFGGWPILKVKGLTNYEGHRVPI